MRYALVLTYSFDRDCQILTFSTEKEACDKCKEFAEEELRIEVEENKYNSELIHEEGWWYAAVISHFREGDDICYYHVAQIE